MLLFLLLFPMIFCLFSCFVHIFLFFLFPLFIFFLQLHRLKFITPPPCPPGKEFFNIYALDLLQNGEHISTVHSGGQSYSYSVTKLHTVPAIKIASPIGKLAFFLNCSCACKNRHRDLKLSQYVLYYQS